MKICMVNVYFDPDMVGGVEWYIKDISSYLARLGHEVEIFASTDTSRQPSLMPEEDIDGVTVHRFPILFGPSYRTRIWPKVLRALSDSAADIIHCYDYLQFQTLGTILATKPPMVVTIFDIQHLVPRPAIKALPIKLADLTASRLVSHTFDKVLVRAPDLIEELVSMGFERQKISVTQSGVRDEFLQPGNGERFKSRYDLEGNIVLYLGRINPTKGLEFLVRAAPAVLSHNPDTTFVLVGPDERNHKTELEARIREEGLQERFRFLDPIYELDEKRDALSASDLFVLPSGYEGTSQAVMQAMAQGIPVVTTRVGGMPFLIRDGFDGFLIPYGSPKSLSARINQLLSDPSLRSRVGRRAKARATRQFLYSRLAKQLADIYHEVA